MRLGAVDGDDEALVRSVGNLGRDPPRHRKAGSDAGHRRLSVVRERVVGAGRDAGDRGPSAVHRHRAMGAVAAEDHDRRHPFGHHRADRAARILDRAGHRELEVPQGGEPLPTRVPRALDSAFHVSPDAGSLRHRKHLGDPAGPEAGEHPEHDVCPVRHLEARRVGDDTPDVPCGKGIRDETDPHSVHPSDPSARHVEGPPRSCRVPALSMSLQADRSGVRATFLGATLPGRRTRVDTREAGRSARAG